MDTGVFKILAAVFFCLGSIGLLALGYREKPGSKNKWKLYAAGGMLFFTTLYTVSLIISTPVLKDILAGASVISMLLIFGYMTGNIIIEYRRSK